MNKKSDKVFEKRKALLDVLFDVTKEKHEKRSEELSKQSNKVELILIAWGFLFAGIAGFYQANILDIYNIPQITWLLLPMLVSVIISVIQVMSVQIEHDVPKLSELWKQYSESFEKNFDEYDETMAKEQLIQEYIEAEEYNRTHLGNKAFWLTVASVLIAVEIVLIVVFITTKN